ncbi:MAG: hypothetical protein ACRDTP_00760, partial [Mycobacteriales bacterium]
WHTSMQGHQNADDTRIGDQGIADTVTASKTVSIDKLDTALRVQVAKESHELVDRCPDADGTVPGDALDKLQFALTASGGSAKVSGSARFEIQTRLTGHVNADGSFNDFDLHMKLTALVKGGTVGKDGKLYSTKAPAYYVYEVEADHNTFASVAGAKDTPVHILRTISPHHSSLGYSLFGRLHFWDPIAKALWNLEYRYGGMVLVKAADDYKQAEAYWQTPGNCVTVTPSAATTKLKPGQQAAVTATVAGPPKKGKGLAPGKFTATASAGTITPTSGSYTPGHPLSFTYTAPSSGGGTSMVTIGTTSRQGKGRGTISFQIQADHYALVYTHTSSGHPTFTYQHYGVFDADGAFTEQEDLALSASAPLTVDAAGTTASGSGPLTWQRSTWSTDDNDVSNSGQDAGIRCGIDYHDQLVTAHPGTMTVKSLTLGPPGADGVPTIKTLDVILWGVGEHWHMDETQVSGPCPGFPQDQDNEVFLSDLQWAYMSFPTKWSALGVTASWASSDYGNMATELKLTAPWSGAPLTSQLPPADYGDVAPASAVIDWVDSFKLARSP